MQKNQPLKKTPKKKKRIFLKILLVLLVILVVFRILLPSIVLRFVNKKLTEMKDYTGHVEDIDIRLYRGAYIIKDIKIQKIEKKNTTADTIPFFSAPVIDLSIQWKALFKGKIVGKIHLEEPKVNFVKGRHKDEDLTADSADFRKLVKKLMPIKINQFDMARGEIHYIDPHSSPHIDIFMQNITVVAKNLTNINEPDKILPASVMATGDIYSGSFRFDMDLNALAETPTFDLNAELKNVNLVNFNPMMQAYGNFDVKKGNFGLYTEFAGKNGSFGGYVKPVIKDLDVVQWTKEEGDFKQILWETLVGTTAAIFTNHRKNQLATKVDIEGKFKNPDINVWRAISFILRNAFLEALRPAIEGTININKTTDTGKKTLLEKVFGKDGKQDKAGNADKKKSRKERREERRREREKRRAERQNEK